MALVLHSYRTKLEKRTTQSSTELQQIISFIRNGWAQRMSLHPLQGFMEQWLIFLNQIVLYQDHIVIPTALRFNVLNQLHEGHQDSNKMLRAGSINCLVAGYWGWNHKEGEILEPLCSAYTHTETGTAYNNNCSSYLWVGRQEFPHWVWEVELPHWKVMESCLYPYCFMLLSVL